MPIRAADSFWPLAKPKQRFFANRGASGIDGLVSSGLGVATGRDPAPTVLMLGDLSLYHDMNGLWALQRHGIRATLVVCDNNGGGAADSVTNNITSVIQTVLAAQLVSNSGMLQPQAEPREGARENGREGSAVGGVLPDTLQNPAPRTGRR